MGLFLYQRPEEQEQKQQEAEEQSLWQFQKHKLSFPSSMQVVLGEFKQLGNITVPVALMNCVVYVRAMVSVFCLGRLGSGQLAGGALSIGFTNITGYSILFGLASGMDPVCSQAFGSNNWELIGVSLQRMILILLAACLPISLLWLNLQPIMLWLGQDPSITSVAATYCLFSLPDLLTNSFIQPLRIYLRSQGITTPMMWCSAVAVVLHVPLNVILVFVLKLGVPGVAMAAVWTNINMLLFLLTYLHFSGVHKTTWSGWSAAALREWCPLLGLAVPSCFAICLEWWWYEIMTVLAGFLPNPTVAVATTAILIQTTSLMYTVPMALGSSVSTRVGNELGAGRPDRAQLATLVALGCAAVTALVHVLWTWLLRERWASVFTDDQDVVALAASVLPLMGLCELGNCPQTTGCGVLRGSARPAVGVRINLGSFYLLGTPVAVALAFWLKIGFGGLWYGLLVAQIACAASILLVVFRTDWNMEASRAKQLAGCQQLQLSPKDANVDVDVDVDVDVAVAVDDDEEKALLPLML